MKKLLLAVVVACAAVSAQAQTSNISAKISSLGFGLEYDYALAPNLEVGVTGHYFSWSGMKFKAKGDRPEHSMDLSWSDVGVVGYYYPIYGSGLTVDAGLFYNGNKIDASVMDHGEWKAEVTYNPIAPMLGVGWRSTLPGMDNLGFAFDAGLYYQGKSKFKYTKKPDNCEQNDYCKPWIPVIKNHVQKYSNYLQVYPVISASLTYRF